MSEPLVEGSDESGIRWRLLGGFLAFGVATIVLWRSPWLLPLKILVVFIHETGHALAAILTGGEVEEIQVWLNQGGVTRTRGGSYLVISSAGYVGSSLFGALLLRASAREKLAPAILGALGVVLVIMTVLYVPFANASGFAFGLLGGLFLIAVAVHRSPYLIYGVMGLAVMSCLYSAYDFADYLLGSPHETDAGLLAAYLGLPVLAYPIGILWSLLSLWIMWAGLSAACTGREPGADHL